MLLPIQRLIRSFRGRGLNYAALLGVSGVGDPAPLSLMTGSPFRICLAPSLRTRHNFLGALGGAEVTLHLIYFHFIYNQFVRPL